MLGFIKKYKNFIPEFIWEWFRLRTILKSHKKVAAFWDNVLNDYEAGKIERYSLSPLMKLESSEKIIWQYWGQGTSADVVPELIQVCFDSVDKNKGEYRVVRLCDDTLPMYVTLPSFIWDKYRNGVMSATHFSDVVRVALLGAYGGVWLDATILLTAPLKDYLNSCDWFLFQRDNKQEDQIQWRRTYAYYFGWHSDFKVRVLSSVMFAKKGSKTMNDWFQMLSFYWDTQNCIQEYFFFQIMINQFLQRFPERNCRIISDCLPNMLQAYLTNSYTKYDIRTILTMISIHKLSYKTIQVEQILNIKELC